MIPRHKCEKCLRFMKVIKNSEGEYKLICECEELCLKI